MLYSNIFLYKNLIACIYSSFFADNIILFFILITAFFYSRTIFNYYLCWHRFLKKENSTFISEDKNLPEISVIIPARNEAENIINCIKCFENQMYPESKKKLIIIDDHSEDKTFEIATKYCCGKKNISIRKLRKNERGKKDAIEAGLKLSSAKFTAFSDADCYQPKLWLRCIADCFMKDSPKMIIGAVRFSPAISFFDKLQEAEFMSLAASTGGAVFRGKPIMANGANMAFVSEVFYNEAISLNKSFASGDDMFLLQSIKEEYGAKNISFMAKKEAVVRTKPNSSLYKLYRQRVRWASKTKGYKDKDIIFGGSIVFLMNLFLSMSIIVSVFYIDAIFIFIFLFTVKSISDYLLLQKANKFFDINFKPFFILLQLIYPFYVLIVGISSFFVSPKWKGRKTLN